MKTLLKNRKQIAKEIGVSVRTLRSRMTKAGMILTGNLLSPEQQKEIYALFGIKMTSDGDKDDRVNQLDGTK